MVIPDWFLNEMAERLAERLLCRLEQEGVPDDVRRLALLTLFATCWAPEPSAAMRADAEAWLWESLRALGG